MAQEALKRIGALYEVERSINGKPPDERRRQRQARSRPLADVLKAWVETILPQLSGRSELAGAFRYMLARWVALVRVLDDGRIALYNNPAERALRGVAVGRKNYLLAGSNRGADRTAALYCLIESAKLNGLDPEAYLRDVLTHIADPPGPAPRRSPPVELGHNRARRSRRLTARATRRALTINSRNRRV